MTTATPRNPVDARLAETAETLRKFQAIVREMHPRVTEAQLMDITQGFNKLIAEVAELATEHNTNDLNPRLTEAEAITTLEKVQALIGEVQSFRETFEARLTKVETDQKVVHQGLGVSVTNGGFTIDPNGRVAQLDAVWLTVGDHGKILEGWTGNGSDDPGDPGLRAKVANHATEIDQLKKTGQGFNFLYFAFTATVVTLLFWLIGFFSFGWVTGIGVGVSLGALAGFIAGSLPKRDSTQTAEQETPQGETRQDSH